MQSHDLPLPVGNARRDVHRIGVTGRPQLVGAPVEREPADDVADAEPGAEPVAGVLVVGPEVPVDPAVDPGVTPVLCPGVVCPGVLDPELLSPGDVVVGALVVVDAGAELVGARDVAVAGAAGTVEPTSVVPPVVAVCVGSGRTKR
jgi:hypothetical protein